MLLAIAGSHVFCEVLHFVQDDKRVWSALGYEPQYPLEKGVADYMRWLYPEVTLPA